MIEIKKGKTKNLVSPNLDFFVKSEIEMAIWQQGGIMNRLDE